MRRLAFWLGILLWPCAAMLAQAAESTVVWSDEAESVVTPAGMRFGTTIVADAAASGGQAVSIPYRADARGWSIVFSPPRMVMRGQVLFTFWLRAEGLPPLTPGMAVTLVAHDKQTGQWAHHWQTRVYGANLNAAGYTPIRLALDVPWTAETYGPEVIFQCDSPPQDIAPVMYLDKVEVAVPILDAPRVLEVATDKVHYRPGDQVAIDTALVNPTDTAVEAILVGEEVRGAATRREVARQACPLAAGQERRVQFAYHLGDEEYGREIRVRLLVGEREVASAREFFAVSRLPLWVAGGSSGDRAAWAGNSGAGSFYVGPASSQDSWRGVRYWQKQRRTYFEFFSWSPGDISDLAPTAAIFPGGEGRLAFRSRETILEQVRMLKSAGLWPVSYVNGTCWAESGYQLFQQHPEWFLYDSTGEVGGYEMAGREHYRRQDDADFNPASYEHIFFQGCLNHARPDVQEYVARQFIACGRQMEFSGVRLDVRYLEVYPGERDFDGREIAATYPDADRISAAAVQRIKALVHQELPDFTFGYNYAAPEEVKNMPETFRERCAGGAWMLDELPCTYQEKSSPFHVWRAYARRMMSWGSQVNQLGGVYNPYDFNRGSLEHPIDSIYSAIFRIICGGRDYGGWYFNSRQPVGDFGAFTTRFSEYLHHADRSWIAELNGAVEVRAAAPLWWQDMCFWTRTHDGRRCLQVNLVNPPRADEVLENPRSEINPPVHDIEVICSPSDGRPPTAAYLLMSEPLEMTGLNDVRVVKLELGDAGAGRIAVRVPSVLFWKMVVFEW